MWDIRQCQANKLNIIHDEPEKEVNNPGGHIEHAEFKGPAAAVPGGQGRGNVMLICGQK